MPIRVYKLAKELGVTSKDIMAEAMNHGIEVQNHMGSLTESQADIIRAFLYVPPPAEEKKPAPKKKAAKKKAARKVAETTPAPEASEADQAEETQESMVELKPVSPPGAREALARRKAADEAEAQRVAAEETAARDAEEAEPGTPELQVSMGNLKSAIVNPGAEAEEKAETPGEPAAADSDEPQVREIKVVAPGADRVMTSKSLPHIDADKPTKELPKRRQATILGRRELPKTKPTTAPRGRDRSSTPVPPSPNEGLTQTKSVGSKRTFVRSPHRGGRGGNRGGGYGSTGGAFGRTGGNRRGQFQRPPKKVSKPVERPTSIEIQLPITVKDLSAAMALKSALIIEQLIKNHGILPSINTMLDKETVELIGIEFDCEINVTEKNLEAEFEQQEVDVWEGGEDDDKNTVTRAPIVTLLGHVDHGKTSLLDYIRKARVAEKEHGGITQHVGAYRIEKDSGPLVFLDTPGHRAFTEMRARGAQVTDVVVLVVAADDGVKPQTEEAIAHAKAAETAIVVAINKCDKQDANVMQVKQQLSGLGLQPEDWGGDTVCVEVSALTGQGVDELLESISLVAELLELKANPERPGVATVIESLQKKGEGNVARVLVTDGTIRRGDSFLCGHVFGKIKSLRLPNGKTAKEVGPSWPAEISGLAELPAAGDRFFVVKDLAKAKSLADERQARIREDRLAARQNTNLENLLKKASTDQFNLILKADTVGSLEVLKKEVLSLAHDEVEPKIIHAAVGGVTDTDVTLADASKAVILGFCVTDSASARRLADERGVEIRHYNVIYNLLDDIKEAMEGKLAPELRETITGHIEVLKTFKISRVGTIAGCLVQDGVIRSTARIRVTRDGILIHDGKLASLRYLKDDVKEVKEGSECGIRLQNFDDVKVGDIFEPYEIEQIKRSLDD